MEEAILIRKSQQGDMDAFEQLILLYEKKVYTIAYKYMGNHEDASDIAQEALINWQLSRRIVFQYMDWPDYGK